MVVECGEHDDTLSQDAQATGAVIVCGQSDYRIAVTLDPTQGRRERNRFKELSTGQRQLK